MKGGAKFNTNGLGFQKIAKFWGNLDQILPKTNKRVIH